MPVYKHIFEQLSKYDLISHSAPEQEIRSS